MDKLNVRTELLRLLNTKDTPLDFKRKFDNYKKNNNGLFKPCSISCGVNSFYLHNLFIFVGMSYVMAKKTPELFYYLLMYSFMTETATTISFVLFSDNDNNSKRKPYIHKTLDILCKDFGISPWALNNSSQNTIKCWLYYWNRRTSVPSYEEFIQGANSASSPNTPKTPPG